MWIEVRNDGKSTSQDTWVLAGDLIYVCENLSGSGNVVGLEKIYNPVGLAIGSQMNLVLATEAMMRAVDYEERRVIPVYEERLKEVFLHESPGTDYGSARSVWQTANIPW